MATDCFVLCMQVQRSSRSDRLDAILDVTPVGAAGDNLLRVTTRPKATGTALASAGRTKSSRPDCGDHARIANRSRCGLRQTDFYRARIESIPSPRFVAFLRSQFMQSSPDNLVREFHYCTVIDIQHMAVARRSSQAQTPLVRPRTGGSPLRHAPPVAAIRGRPSRG